MLGLFLIYVEKITPLGYYKILFGDMYALYRLLTLAIINRLNDL